MPWNIFINAKTVSYVRNQLLLLLLVTLLSSGSQVLVLEVKFLKISDLALGRSSSYRNAFDTAESSTRLNWFDTSILTMAHVYIEIEIIWTYPCLQKTANWEQLEGVCVCLIHASSSSLFTIIYIFMIRCSRSWFPATGPDLGLNLCKCQMHDVHNVPCNPGQFDQ